MATSKETLGAPLNENKATNLYDLIRTFDQAPSTIERRKKIIGELKNLDEDGRKSYKDGEHVTEKLDGETILHTAVAHLNEAKKNHSKIFDAILEEMPYLVKQNRQFSAKYRGQTPFHMAVCKGNVSLVNKLLEALRNRGEDYKKLMEIRATGGVFENTAMMGELPLTVAALTGNIGTCSFFVLQTLPVLKLPKITNLQNFKRISSFVMFSFFSFLVLIIFVFV